jgi:hypothetical protein
MWAGLLASCPSTPPPACLDQVCTAKQATCVGNAVAVCDPDGKGWTLSSCGSARYCVGGTCANRSCQDLGLGTCSDGATLEVCAPSGLGTTTQKCAGGEACDKVACVAPTCQDGTTSCEDWKHLFLCTGGTRTYETCPEACGKDASGKPACVPFTCTPEATRCEGQTSWRCDHTGLEEVATACGAGQVCLDGFCQTKLCAPIEDATTGDGGEVSDGTDLAEAEAPPEPFCGDGNCDPDELCSTCAVDCGPCPVQPAKIEFKVHNVTEVMDLDAKADWNAADQTIFLKGSHGLKKIEIHIQKVDALAVGTWDDTDTTGVVVKICYVDAAGNPSLACAGTTPGFTHVAILYTLTIAENNGIGSRIKGTFEATLQDQDQQNLQMTNGVFDLQYFN